MNNEHKVVLVSVGEKSALIDSGIAKLIELCWKYGFQTEQSCQKMINGYSWIMFAAESASKFFELIICNENPIKEALNLYQGYPEKATEYDWSVYTGFFIDNGMIPTGLYVDVYFKPNYIKDIEKILSN